MAQDIWASEILKDTVLEFSTYFKLPEGFDADSLRQQVFLSRQTLSPPPADIFPSALYRTRYKGITNPEELQYVELDKIDFFGELPPTATIYGRQCVSEKLVNIVKRFNVAWYFYSVDVFDLDGETPLFGERYFLTDCFFVPKKPIFLPEQSGRTRISGTTWIVGGGLKDDQIAIVENGLGDIDLCMAANLSGILFASDRLVRVIMDAGMNEMTVRGERYRLFDFKKCKQVRSSLETVS
jgi:hypothetical protein